MNSTQRGLGWRAVVLLLAVTAAIGAAASVAGAREEFGPYPFIFSLFGGSQVGALVAILLAVLPKLDLRVRRFVVAATALWIGAAVVGSGLGYYWRFAGEERVCRERMALCEELIPSLETHRRVHGQLPTTLAALDSPTELPPGLRGSGVWFFSNGERFGFAVSGAAFLTLSWNYYDSRQALWLQDVGDGEPDAELAELQRLCELGEKL